MKNVCRKKRNKERTYTQKMIDKARPVRIDKQFPINCECFNTWKIAQFVECIVRFFFVALRICHHLAAWWNACSFMHICHFELCRCLFFSFFGCSPEMLCTLSFVVFLCVASLDRNYLLDWNGFSFLLFSSLIQLLFFLTSAWSYRKSLDSMNVINQPIFETHLLV